MSIWRRGEPLHAKLAREGGLALDFEPVREPVGYRLPVGVHGNARPREWDAVATAEAPDLTGDEVGFAALPDGTLLVDGDEPEGALDPLVDALERTLAPPYRARATRRDGDLWAVAARRIEVVELADAPGEEEIVLTSRRGAHTLSVDGFETFGTVPELERLAEARHADYVLRAVRLDGPLWEVELRPL